MYLRIQSKTVNSVTYDVTVRWDRWREQSEGRFTLTVLNHTVMNNNYTYCKVTDIIIKLKNWVIFMKHMFIKVLLLDRYRFRNICNCMVHYIHLESINLIEYQILCCMFYLYIPILRQVFSFKWMLSTEILCNIKLKAPINTLPTYDRTHEYFSHTMNVGMSALSVCLKGSTCEPGTITAVQRISMCRNNSSKIK